MSLEIKRIFLEIRNNIRQLSQESILIQNINMYLKIGQDGNFWLELIDHLKICPEGMNHKQKSIENKTNGYKFNTHLKV